MARGPNVPHPGSKQTGEIGQEGVRIRARSWPSPDLSWRSDHTLGSQGGKKVPWTLSGQARGLIQAHKGSALKKVTGVSHERAWHLKMSSEPAGRSQIIWVEHHYVCWTQHREPSEDQSRGVETCDEEVARDQIIEGLWTFTLVVMRRLGDILGKAGHDLIYILKVSMKLLFEF